MHPIAKTYCLEKLEEAPDTIKGATSWGSVRNWLIANGMIFTQPLTRTTNYGRQVNQQHAEGSAHDAVAQVARANGFRVQDLPANVHLAIVERSRSDVNAGTTPFDVAKGLLQDSALDTRIRPHLLLRYAYEDSAALANEVGLGERQLHHLITRSMVAALQASQPQLDAQAMRDNPTYQYMSSPGGHIGYETWHRHYDNQMLAYIRSVPPNTMTEAQLITRVHIYYQSDHGFGVTRRVPGVSLI
jgi:hypothetical protein